MKSDVEMLFCQIAPGQFLSWNGRNLIPIGSISKKGLIQVIQSSTAPEKQKQIFIQMVNGEQQVVQQKSKEEDLQRIQTPKEQIIQDLSSLGEDLQENAILQLRGELNELRRRLKLPPLK